MIAKDAETDDVALQVLYAPLEEGAKMVVEAYLKKKFRPKFALGSNNYSHFTFFLSALTPQKIRGVSVGLLFKKTKKNGTQMVEIQSIIHFP